MVFQFLKLIRFSNLLMIAASQYLMRWCIIYPILRNSNIEMQFSNLNFALMVTATVLIAAAGYIVNDYLDTKADMINRPENIIIGKYIGRKTAVALHVILNIVGISLGVYVSFAIDFYQLGFIYLLTTGMLWYYSTTYKRQFLVGNLIVSALVAIVPFMVALYEIPLLNKAFGKLLESGENFSQLSWAIAIFSFFAFITTLIREIIKDAEDLEGDSAYGCNTMPVVIGMISTKIILIILILATMGGLSYVYMNFLVDISYTLPYIIVTMGIPFLLLIFKIIIANKKRDYTFASITIKLISIFGLLYSLIIYYSFTFGNVIE